MLVFLISFNESYGENYNETTEFTFEEGDAVSLQQDDTGRVKFFLKNKKSILSFENKVFLIEYRKTPTWSEARANAELHVPLPDHIGKRYSKVIYSPLVEYISSNRKYITAIGFNFSALYEPEKWSSDFKDWHISVQRRASKDFMLSTYFGFTLRRGKQDGIKFEEFSGFTSNHIDLNSLIINAFLKIDVGYKANKIKKEIYLSAFFTAPLNDETWIILESEISTLVSLKSKRKNSQDNINFKRYGAYNLSVGTKIEIQKDMYVKCLFYHENNTRYGFEANGLIFSYIINF